MTIKVSEEVSLSPKEIEQLMKLVHAKLETIDPENKKQKKELTEIKNKLFAVQW